MTASSDQVRRRVGIGPPVMLLLGGACLAAEPPAPAAPAADGFRMERHSPPGGYPSLGPSGARNTLVFFTDYQ